MFRIQLTSNTSAKNPIAEKIIIFDTFEKFKLAKLRLFVTKPFINAQVGMEITTEK